MNPNMPDNRTNKRKIGDLGEDLACKFLEKRGFRVIERNYLRKWGEIDIIAKIGSRYRFVEVKTMNVVDDGVVSHEPLNPHRNKVTHATSYKDSQETNFRPEENVHMGKLKRLLRTVETYLLDKNIESEWQLDLITVRLNMKTHMAKVELIENINI